MFMKINDYLKTVRTHGTRMLVTLCVACCGSALFAQTSQTISVTGVVTDNAGEPLIGVTVYEKDCNYLDAISQADNALYKAKNNGRNQVILYTK